jgi:hypothetical protein
MKTPKQYSAMNVTLNMKVKGTASNEWNKEEEERNVGGFHISFNTGSKWHRRTKCHSMEGGSVKDGKNVTEKQNGIV